MRWTVAVVGLLTMIVGCAPKPPVTVGSCSESEAATAVAAGPSAVVVATDAAQRLVAASGKAWITRLAQGEQAFVGVLELAAGAAVPEHQDATEEYIYVLSGRGEVKINGETHAVSPRTLFFMPAGATVSYQNGPEPLVALQIFAGPAPAAKYDKWKAAPAP